MKKNPVGRPKGRNFRLQLNVLVNAESMKKLHRWRAEQEDTPGRSEAIRRLIDMAGKEKIAC